MTKVEQRGEENGNNMKNREKYWGFKLRIHRFTWNPRIYWNPSRYWKILKKSNNTNGFQWVMVSTQDSESCDPSSNLGGTSTM